MWSSWSSTAWASSGSRDSSLILAGKRLGGGHADFGAGVKVDPPARLPGDSGTDHVTDTQDVGALALAFPQCRQGIGSFSRLTDGQHASPALNDRVAVTKFRRLHDIGGDIGKLLEQMFAHHSGVQ